VSYSYSSKVSASACHPQQGGDLSLGVLAGGPATGSREVRDAGGRPHYCWDDDAGRPRD
jgi:hypothetical protein